MILALTLAAAAAVFALDLQMPLGVAVGMLYVSVMLPSSVLARGRPVIALAVLTTILTLLGWVLSPRGGVPWMAAANRLVSILAIWAVATAAVQHHPVRMRTATDHRRVAEPPGALPLALRVFCPVHEVEARVRVFVTPGSETVRLGECSLWPGDGSRPACEGRCVVIAAEGGREPTEVGRDGGARDGE